jgi:predicted nuclease with RNAse H fold
MRGITDLVVVGIDLAGSPKRPTGICVLQGDRARTQLAYSVDEIMAIVAEADPDIVPIDAPLSLPPGRKTIADRSGEHFRPCDRELQKLGIRFFPITLGPMRMLTERGLALKTQLGALGYVAVECYPGGAQDQWGMPRQHKSMSGLLRGLRKMGLRGLRANASPHELDAASAALAGHHLLLGEAVMLGGEGGMIMPMAPEG